SPSATALCRHDCGGRHCPAAYPSSSSSRTTTSTATTPHTDGASTSTPSPTGRAAITMITANPSSSLTAPSSNLCPTSISGPTYCTPTTGKPGSSRSASASSTARAATCACACTTTAFTP